ncbi:MULTISPECIES: MFS transporter permease [unclassified Microbacterium]|uniref:MFS transporter permease n=1 Tax=unclassified Microbacterium TaxID=2609290 RepID=UPI000DD17086|nr:MFS transporter permease [Microbacterium sp. PM5]AXA95704.1 MFS transporter permease [Microbacterium sp. PM5]
MWLRQTFFRWLIPAAFVLPLWLVVGWIVFGASPWALLWVLLSAPIVFVWQLVLALLVRARGTVRAERAVSWTDAGLIGAWHVLVVALGVFDGRWWWPTLAVTIVLGVVALSSALRQLWRETGPRVSILRTVSGVGYVPPARPEHTGGSNPEEIIVIRENTPPGS